MSPGELRAPLKRSLGITLTELLVVLILLGILAIMALPDLSAGRSTELEQAAGEVASLIRFARSEALRTETTHCIKANLSSQSIDGYALEILPDLTVNITKLTDPLSKQPYVINFSNGITDIELISADFQYVALGGPVPDLCFAGNTAVPHVFQSNQYWLMQGGSISLGSAGLVSAVSVAPMTGRVTLP